MLYERKHVNLFPRWNNVIKVLNLTCFPATTLKNVQLMQLSADHYNKKQKFKQYSLFFQIKVFLYWNITFLHHRCVNFSWSPPHSLGPSSARLCSAWHPGGSEAALRTTSSPDFLALRHLLHLANGRNQEIRARAEREVWVFLSPFSLLKRLWFWQ